MREDNSFFQIIKNEPLEYRWFLLLVLLRPIIDIFYELKNVSIFASPLYWVGVSTPILVVLSIIKHGKALKTDFSFGLWSIIGFFNIIIILIMTNASIDGIMVALKVTIIFVLYYYLRVFINNMHRFNLTIRAIAYSSVTVYVMIVYEYIFGSINSTVTTGGVEVSSGLYADSVSYGLYLNISLICWFFIYYNNLYKRIYRLILIISITLVGLLSIGHLASMAFFVINLIMLFVVKFKRNIIAALALSSVLLLTIYAIVEEVFEDQYMPKLNRETEVIIGERDEAQGFHGRMTRWRYLIYEWERNSLFTKAFGVSLDVDRYLHYGAWILVNPHNDYLRIMFFTGITGLLLYLSWLIKVFRVSFSLDQELAYISRVSILLIMLYSITTLPSLYTQILYFTMTVFGFTLNLKNQNENMKSEAKRLASASLQK